MEQCIRTPVVSAPGLFSCASSLPDILRVAQLLTTFLQLLPSHISLAYAATAVDLGAAGQYAILGRFGTTVGALVEIDGDVAVSPSLSTTLVGFALVPADGYGT